MPSLKLSNPFRRNTARPSLRERAATLKATAGRVLRPKAPPAPTSEPEVVDWHSPPPGFMAHPAIEPGGFVIIKSGIRLEAKRLYGIALAEFDRRMGSYRGRYGERSEAEWTAYLRRELHVDALHDLAYRPERAFAAAEALQRDVSPAEADAELRALAPEWRAARDLYARRMREAEALCDAAKGTGPGPSPRNAGREHADWLRRVEEWRERTGIGNAEDASGEALDALCDIEDRVAGLPASTLAGLQIKALVAQRNDDIDIAWPKGLGEGLVRDLLVFAEAVPAEADAALIALGSELDAVQARLAEADRDCDASANAATAAMPERPACLFFRETDDAFNLKYRSIHCSELDGIPIEGADIAWMKRGPRQHQVLRDARPGERAWRDYPGKVPELVPWPEAQARTDEIVTAWVAWMAARHAVDEAHGTFEAEERAIAAGAESAAIMHQVAAIPATTAEGLRIKLRALGRSAEDMDLGGASGAVFRSVMRDAGVPETAFAAAAEG